ncbi:hypothetical protein C4561_02920 [candidate division WWE3 bacterium]|jgi:hypothetical protein|uniref:Metal-dependent hydrolase n=1 Tax=candidate division WWE3 bacterium TaxID=2053526 RepID=A0A3A4ZCX9_UNCKA|nr:MAG: hypothetical protein C4561_02920 [candidate division WWE3 bacterium]
MKSMTTVAHIVSASYITLKVANVAPNELDYIATSLISAGILDLDHLFFLIRDRKIFKKVGFSGHLHKARSPIHELLGFLIIGVVMLAVSFFNPKLALVLGLPAMIHLIEDLLVGISLPFSPVDKTEIQLIPQKKTIKIFLDVTVIIIFAILWIKYLNVVN